MQVLTCVKGLGLESYIIDNTPTPPQVLSENGAPEPLIQTMLYGLDRINSSSHFPLASTSESVQRQMIGCQTST